MNKETAKSIANYLSVLPIVGGAMTVKSITKIVACDKHGLFEKACCQSFALGIGILSAKTFNQALKDVIDFYYDKKEISESEEEE